MRDTTCLLELNEKSGFLDTKLAVMETLNLPLSCSIYDTPRKNLELFLMRLYTEQGYAI